MEPIQVVLSGNLKKHKAIHCPFMILSRIWHEKYGSQSRKASSSSNARTSSCIYLFFYPFISKHVLNAPYVPTPMSDAANTEMKKSSQTRTDRLVNKPPILHHQWDSSRGRCKVEK